MMSDSSPLNRLSELERLGALLGRFMHDLSNEATSLVTIFSLAPEPTPQDWQEASLSVQRLGQHLRQCNEILQRVRPGVTLVSSEELLKRVLEIGTQFPGWNYQHEMTEPIAVYGQADWLVGALTEILLELQLRGVVSGEIRTCVVPASQLDRLKLIPKFSSRKESKFLLVEISFLDLGLSLESESILKTFQPTWLIITELIRQMRGHLFLEKKARRQSLLICLSGT